MEIAALTNVVVTLLSNDEFEVAATLLMELPPHIGMQICLDLHDQTTVVERHSLRCNMVSVSKGQRNG